jgi:hypothetical protein
VIPPELRENNHNIREDYCHREEVAHPRKLQLLNNVHQSNVEIIEHNDVFFYSTTIPWSTTYNSYGVSSYGQYFHVLCQTPSMFDIDYDNLSGWFNKYHNSMFLITHVVNTDGSGRKFVNSPCGHSTHILDEELPTILNKSCYTICNGLIYLLAMHRIGNIRSQDIEHILEDHFNNLIMDYYQFVTEDWEELYYTHNGPTVADFPLYYACMGPDFADSNVLSVFKRFQDLHIMIKTGTNGRITFTSPQSAMYPHFSHDHLRNHDEQSLWRDWQVPDTAIMGGFIALLSNTQPRVYPDFAGIIQAFVCNDDGWNFLNDTTTGIDIIAILFQYPSTTRRRMVEMFRAAFHFWSYGSITIKSRIQVLWRNVLSRVHDITTIVYVSCILYMYGVIKYVKHIPLDYLKDIIDICEGECLVKAVHIGGSASDNMKQIFIDTIPGITFDENSYAFKTTLFDMVKTSPEHKMYINECIKNKILVMKRIAERDTIGNGYEVYCLVMNYISRHKELLF